MKSSLFISVCVATAVFLLCLPGRAMAQCDSLRADSGQQIPPTKAPKKLSWLRRTIRGFTQIDTTYIEPQRYNFTVMIQNTGSFDRYTLHDNSGMSVRFAPKPSNKIGPYFGWRWIFLGYTVDIFAHDAGSRQSLNLSLYANQLGVDLFYRKSGDNYRIDHFSVKSDISTGALKNVSFDGFNSSERGINLYYIFNHKKFSYPAAYSQSTIQRRSCGTALAGFSYSSHSVDVDWEKFYHLVDEKLGAGTSAEILDTTRHSANVKYIDYALSGGYAYNWVFAKNWLLDISAQGALAYKKSHSDVNTNNKGFFRELDFKNFNVDAIGRFAVVWNNMRWYAGLSAVFHTYNYLRNKFYVNTTFGNVNVYFGYNFGKRK